LCEKLRRAPTKQQLLELALLDHADREIADRVELTADAVKKRWRSVYVRVASVGVKAALPARVIMCPPEIAALTQQASPKVP
jgi:hypothetical protein